ncbi:MAG TPA: glycosyltransferase 87 family protein [Bryobacteraceae bacterium]|nr:glycosyltransferase 87 family protein [Bryobacteraceae bacterium]
MAGAVFRVTVWPIGPSLSDDPYRYRWEGKLQAVGGNPYAARPRDPEWVQLRDSTYPKVVGKDFKAVYGPLIEQVEVWTYRVASKLTPDPERQVFWFKLPYALCDLGAMAALWLLLAAHHLPRERILIYAWSPLSVFEFWATGHNDALVVLAVILALVAAKRERWTWAFVALALAVAAKIWPVMLVPLFIGWRRYRPRRWYQWWVAVPILIGFMLPYWTDIWENLRFMSGFVGGWRNNDSLFGAILYFTDDLYRAKYTAFAIVALAVAILTLREVRLERAALAAIAVMLMVSANCHPWYLTWMLPLLALAPVTALLLWTALVPLAYAAVISWVALGEWQGSTAIRWYEYVPVYAMLIGPPLAAWLRRRFLRSSARTAG